MYMKLPGFRILFCLFSIEGLILSSALYGSRLPEGGLLGSGFSSINLVLLFGVLAGTLGSIVLVIVPRLSNDISKRFARFLDNDHKFIWLLVGCFLILYESIQDILFLQADIEPIHYQGYRVFIEEHFMLLWGAFFISLQLIIFVFIQRWSIIKSWLNKLSASKVFYAFVFLGIFIIAVSASGLGAIIASARFPGFIVLSVPILGIQVLFVLLGILLLAFLNKIFKFKLNWEWFDNRDWILMVIIGLVAYSAWISVPIGASAFTDIQRPPNFEFYPTSDALHFDQGAHQILVGNGFKNYSHVGFQLYLAVLHWLAGDSYQQVLPLQLAVLCLIPMLLYRLTSLLNNRTAGILISTLYIIRARNGIFLGEHVTNPSVFDLMSEPYGALGVILVSTLFVSWFLKPAQHRIYPLLMGGLIAFTAFIRAESLALFPIILVFIIYRLRHSHQAWIKEIISSGLGFVLIVGPVLISQFYTTRSPEVLLFGKAQNFEWALPHYQSEKNSEQSENRSDLSDIYPYHVLNNILQYVIYLPSNHQPFLTIASLPDLIAGDSQLADMEGDSFSEKYLERYIRSLPFWWRGEWNGSLAPRSYLPVLGTLLLITVGFSKVTNKKRLLVIALIGFLVVHSLVYSFIGQSGGRFIQMMDWIPLVLYSIGLSWILGVMFKYFSLERPEFLWSEMLSPAEENQIYQPINYRKYLLTSFILLVIGLSFPAVDQWALQRYTSDSLDAIVSQIAGIYVYDEEGISADLSEFTDLRVVYGKALYPRFFKAGKRMDDTRSGSTPDFSSRRTEFFLVGTENIWVSLPAGVEIGVIPHGAEVVVVGIHQNELLREQGRLISGEYINAMKIYQVDYGPDQSIVSVRCLVGYCH
jgi:hypothetical protein